MGSTRRMDYPGRDLAVRWDGRICIAIGECGRSHDDMFVGGRKPWCEPDAVDPERALEVVRRCPAGALSVSTRDGRPLERPPRRNTCVVANAGPLYLSGNLAIPGGEDLPGTRTRAALCRCGHSTEKPFCDNSHRTAGFVDAGAVGPSGEPVEREGGPLQVQPAPDGPLVVSGNLTIVSGSGRVAWHGTRAALCRCGASKDKPFCDGAHARVGFQAP